MQSLRHLARGAPPTLARALSTTYVPANAGFPTARVTRRAPRDRADACAPYHAAGERPRYPKRRQAGSRARALLAALDGEERARLERTGRAVAPRLETGMVVRVKHVVDPARGRTQYFTGIVMGVRNSGIGSSFTLRNVVEGVAVERSWPVYSPLIREAVVVGRRKVYRNKLYFLREKPIKDSTFGSATRRPVEERGK